MTVVQDDPAAEFKRQAGEFAAGLVEDGMVVGLGTGSTAAFLVDALGRRMREGLNFKAIPTSVKTENQARELGIEVVTLATHPVIDLAIDGADEIERGTLNLIKGLGGALLREKIVASASKRFVVMADNRKLVDHLGAHCVVPVEVTPFGWEATARHLGALGARVDARHNRNGDLFVTDGGNMILDCHFGVIENPAELETGIRAIVGVVESGLFIGRAVEAIVTGPDGLARLPRQ